MHSTLIVARMDPGAVADVAALFTDFDSSGMPGRMGTRRRQLFTYQGLYFHLQDFDDAQGDQAIAAARTDARFQQISGDLRPFITAYDPSTWTSPADALAQRFYHWSSEG